MSLFDYVPPTPEPAPTNQAPYTVSELSGALKRTVEGAFGLVRVRGEIVQPKLNNGNLYFSLKDDAAVIDAVCWKGKVIKLPLAAEHGIEVIATGKLTTYPGRSKYQIVVETMELAGQGALFKLIEDRKQRLMAEGLFDAAHKRTLPYIPRRIGLVTSPSGAVLHDILHRLADRFPRPVLVWPVAVQGPGAAEQIAAAVNGFNALPLPSSRGLSTGSTVQPMGPANKSRDDGGKILRPDLIIVARGGGSIEDLMPFNEEIVVRAVAASTIPVIAAVGHETDHTLIDLVADRRAPTPTAAAEFAVPVRASLLQQLDESGFRLRQAAWQAYERPRTQLQALARGLADPRRLLDTSRQSLDDRAERLAQAMQNRLAAQKLHLDRAAAGLKHPRVQLTEAAHRLFVLEGRLRQVWRDETGEARRKLAFALHSLQTSTIGLHRQALSRFATIVPRLTGAALQRQLRQSTGQWEALGRQLESLSYRNVLARGFAVVRDTASKPVSQGATLAEGQNVELEFSDRKLKAQISQTS
jgi:exodeoxyribonuclease VII large subunit